jgi:hypothetical protein
MRTQDDQTVRGVRLQTFKRAFSQIVAGEEPWIALGNFMHQFFGAYRDYRAELLREEIEVPDELSVEQWRWAVYIAASVEYLGQRYGLEIPAWAMAEHYRLAEPWYDDLCADLAEVQQELREETPEEFARRNVFCGADPWANKYEKSRRRIVDDESQERKTA